MKASPIGFSFGMILLLIGIFLAAWADEERRYFEARIESRIHYPNEAILSPYTFGDLEQTRSRASQAMLIGGSIAALGSSLLSAGLLSRRIKQSNDGVV